MMLPRPDGPTAATAVARPLRDRDRDRSWSSASRAAPAQKAGLKTGDVVLVVAAEVSDLAGSIGASGRVGRRRRGAAHGAIATAAPSSRPSSRPTATASSRRRAGSLHIHPQANDCLSRAHAGLAFGRPEA